MELNNWTEEDINRCKIAFMNMAKHYIPGFTVDERNKEVINDLFYYFHKLEGGRLDPEKGLWLEGTIGTGKSSLITIFASHLRRFWNDLGFKIYNCTFIANEYANSNAADPLDRYTYNLNGYKPIPAKMCFDELGREPIHALRYGQKLNVMEYILQIRYTLWQSDRLHTYITTNLDADEVETLYQDYIRDRRAEMFNIVSMTGDSRR